MLLSKQRYADFTKKEIADPTKTSEVLLCLSAESREKVDELCDKALAAGGSGTRRPRTTASSTAAPSTTWTATRGRSCRCGPGRGPRAEHPGGDLRASIPWKEPALRSDSPSPEQETAARRRRTHP